jgi:glycyl-tRNA synthetase beta chain
VPLLCHFDEAFLTVPKEALISAMQNHQKCFAIQHDDALLPYFITISNIESHDQNTVIHGNERVMHARLSDAKFFYDTDCKETLESRLEKLKHIVFQAKLGTLYEKSERIANLAKFIAEKLHRDSGLAKRAGLLCKTDLVSNMVKEFPELQGIMGHYYALHDKEDKEIALAIRNQYKDPTNDIGYCVALADRIDTLVGIFSINQIPTGDKDPFGLRRAAIAVLTIIIKQELKLNLLELIEYATQIQIATCNTTLANQVHEFILERLSGLEIYRKINPSVVTAVLASTDIHSPLALHQRIIALQEQLVSPEMAALAEANKRANNLLKKSDLNETFNNPLKQIVSDLFQHESERALFDKLKAINISNEDYSASLKALATLQIPVANFFDHVMVMDENINVRNNRLAMLATLRQLFLQIADISLLQNNA